MITEAEQYGWMATVPELCSENDQPVDLEAIASDELAATMIDGADTHSREQASIDVALVQSIDLPVSSRIKTEIAQEASPSNIGAAACISCVGCPFVSRCDKPAAVAYRASEDEYMDQAVWGADSRLPTEKQRTVSYLYQLLRPETAPPGSPENIVWAIDQRQLSVKPRTVAEPLEKRTEPALVGGQFRDIDISSCASAAAGHAERQNIYTRPAHDNQSQSPEQKVQVNSPPDPPPARLQDVQAAPRKHNSPDVPTAPPVLYVPPQGRRLESLAPAALSPCQSSDELAIITHKPPKPSLSIETEQSIESNESWFAPSFSAQLAEQIFANDQEYIDTVPPCSPVDDTMLSTMPVTYRPIDHPTVISDAIPSDITGDLSPVTPNSSGPSEPLRSQVTKVLVQTESVARALVPSYSTKPFQTESCEVTRRPLDTLPALDLDVEPKLGLAGDRLMNKETITPQQTINLVMSNTPATDIDATTPQSDDCGKVPSCQITIDEPGITPYTTYEISSPDIPNISVQHNLRNQPTSRFAMFDRYTMLSATSLISQQPQELWLLLAKVVLRVMGVKSRGSRENAILGV